MNNRTFNIISILLILVWIWADRYLKIGAPAYGWLLLIYVTVLFCGSYFIQMRFFMKSICSVNTSDKIMAISFDDGPSGGKTEYILNILADHQVEAAFFCIGKNMPGQEELVNKIIHEGHMIGNHSYSHHRFFDLFSSKRMQEDIEQMSRTCRKVSGLSPRFFRPPYGVTNPNLNKATRLGGFITVGWSIRSYDTVIKNEQRLLERILSGLKPGAILLLHDSSETTLQVLPELIKKIRNRGYQIIRLDKMINLNPYD